jgi:hypothetical protein
VRIKSVFRPLVLLLISGLPGVRAEEFYVSMEGNDSNPGTFSEPFRTITHAYSFAAPGVTIIVMPGVYTDYRSRWGLHLDKFGTAANPIVLRSHSRGGAIIDGQNAADRNVGIYIDGSHNIIDGFQVKGGPNGGISIWGNANQILNNEIHHNGNETGGSGVFSGWDHNSYIGNYIHDNGIPGSNLDHGIYLCGDNELVANNVVAQNAAFGIHVAGYITVSNLNIYNNVVAFNGKSGIILWLDLSGVDIKNNILYQNGNWAVDSYDAHGSDVVIDYNLVFGNNFGDYNFAGGGSDHAYFLGSTIFADPLFLNSISTTFDPRLSPDSAAINAGINLSTSLSTDKDGAPRPLTGPWDLGVFEYE